MSKKFESGAQKRQKKRLFELAARISDNSAQDNSARTIRRRVYIINFMENPASTQQYSFHQFRFHFSNFSLIPLPFRQYFSSILIPNSYYLERNRPINRIYNLIVIHCNHIKEVYLMTNKC